MAIHLSLGLALLGSGLLAAVLARHAARVPGARLLILFLLGVSAWILGNELPALLGPGAERAGLALLATAPLTSAVFLHFALAFTGTNLSRRTVAAAYVLGGGAALLALLVRPGSFGPYAGLPFVATPNAVGWFASMVWGGLGVRTRKCAECPARANGGGTQAASSEGLVRSGLSAPGAGWASAAQT